MKNVVVIGGGTGLSGGNGMKVTPEVTILDAAKKQADADVTVELWMTGEAPGGSDVSFIFLPWGTYVMSCALWRRRRVSLRLL